MFAFRKVIFAGASGTIVIVLKGREMRLLIQLNIRGEEGARYCLQIFWHPNYSYLQQLQHFFLMKSLNRFAQAENCDRKSYFSILID